jgi:chromosome partitioning protein
MYVICPTISRATIRSYLQRFLQNTGGEEVFQHQGEHKDPHVSLVA